MTIFSLKQWHHITLYTVQQRQINGIKTHVTHHGGHVGNGRSSGHWCHGVSGWGACLPIVLWECCIVVVMVIVGVRKEGPSKRKVLVNCCVVIEIPNRFKKKAKYHHINSSNYWWLHHGYDTSWMSKTRTYEGINSHTTRSVDNPRWGKFHQRHRNFWINNGWEHASKN